MRMGNLQVGRLVDTEQAVTLSPGWCEWWGPGEQAVLLSETDRRTLPSRDGTWVCLPSCGAMLRGRQ